MLTPASTYQELRDSFQWTIPPRYNIGVDVCDKWIHEPDRPALIHVDETGGAQEFTFADMRRLSNQTANLLRARGIGRGDRVAILLPQAPETAYSHVAVAKLGAIAVPLFVLFGTDALAFRLQDSGARALITDGDGAAKLAGIRASLPALDCILTVDGPAAHCIDFHAERQGQPDEFAPVDTIADDPALLVYTSGTTGAPKGALHAHRVLPGHLPGVEMSHDFFPQPGDRVWTPADWAWIGGLYDVLMPAWHHGVTVVSRRFAKFDPVAAYQLLADYRIRNAFLPPTALKMMRTVEDPHARWDFELRTIASGGEALGAELLEWGRRTFGLTINEFYGQTECNMIVSNCGAIADARPGSIGFAAPGHEVAVIDLYGNPLPAGQIGEIAVRQPDPVMFLEYWNNPEATRAKFVDDWLVTGDMGVQNEDGTFRFIGRNDDVIISAGYRIGPGEIEDCLLRHPAVRMVAVVGVPDDLRNAAVKAYIVLNDGLVGDEELRLEIQNHVKQSLAAHEYPRHIAFVDALPMTTTGKIVRRTLRAWHEEGIA